ncbi:MAG: hypothetical protein NVS3B7_10470 [Candidatus Elarobacter sp.]
MTGAVPKMSRGVRLRRDPDGSPILLIPEGLLRLNPTAAAALELVDGRHSVGEIVESLCTQFDVDRDDVARDVVALIDRLALRGYLSR